MLILQDEKLVAILLCTFNGENYLREQLDSIWCQKHKNWVVYVSDDGSTDGTLPLLMSYQRAWGVHRLVILSGPAKGFAKNFISLASNKKIIANYYAFCDQDDIWLPSKLELALFNITNHEEVCVPYLYCGRTKYFSDKSSEMSSSPLFKRAPKFQNAIVQSIAGGNTMVFNQSAKGLLEKCSDIDVVSHDWWLYIITTAVGGNVYYDSTPQVLYRQHLSSLVGRNDNFSAKCKRLSMLLKGRYKLWNDRNILALKLTNLPLTEENSETLYLFTKLKACHSIKALYLAFKSGIYRQTFHGSVSLILAIVLKKV